MINDQEKEHGLLQKEDEEFILPEQDPTSNFCGEIFSILQLAIPQSISSISWVAMKTTDTALLGHTGTKYLTASSISDLYTSSTGVFIQGRVLGIFCSQAVGAGNPKLAGVWLQVSIYILLWIALPVILLWVASQWALEFLFGVGTETARNAGYYAIVLSSCIPARIFFSQMGQFFTSQRIMNPSVYTGIFSMLWNLIFGLIFVLGFPIPGWKGFGFVACPIVTAATEWAALLFFFLVFWVYRGLHKPCWPEDGIACSHLTADRLWKYTKMYVPAALSIASDFWRLSAIGVVAATLGEDEIAVFNSSYRILWMCLIFIGSCATAVGIKMGQALGAGQVNQARWVTFVGSCLTISILVILSGIVYTIPRTLGGIFTSDPKLLDMYEEIRIPLASMMFLMNFSVFLERIPMTMGRATVVLYLGLIGSWVGQVPGVILVTRFWRNDLVGVYTGCSVGYGLLSALFIIVIAMSDWAYFAKEAIERSEKK